MIRLGRLAGACAVLCVACMPAAAQEGVPPVTGYIESQGEATVEMAPDLVGFWLHKSVSGPTITDALAAAGRFKDVLDEQLKASGLPEPSEKTVSDVSFADINVPEAKVSAHLLFSARRYATPDSGLQEFAQLCDGILALAKTLECTVDGPVFTVQAKDEVVQTAVARAVEQALTPALGAARVMRTRIETVDAVVVQEVTWNNDPESLAPQPQVRRVTCTARVQVRYIFGPSGA